MDNLENFNSSLSVTDTQPLNYNDFVSSQIGHENSAYAGYGLGGSIMNWMTGAADMSRDDYNNYLAMKEREWDLAKINDARRWEEYMDSTKYQRAMKDIENAGYNPLLAITGGTSQTAPSSPSSASASGNRISKRSDQVGDMAALVGTALKVAAMFMMSNAAGVKAAAAASGAALAKEKWEHDGYQEHSWIKNGVLHKYHYR